MQFNPIQKMSTEVVLACILMLLPEVLPVNWWVHSIALILTCVFVADMVRRLSWTKTKKIACCVATFLVLFLVAIPDILGQYRASLSVKNESSLQSSPATPTSSTIFNEDLRVSFAISFAPPTETITYVFRNLGGQAELIDGLELFEVVKKESDLNAQNYLKSCDNIDPEKVEIWRNTFFMGPGHQIGNDNSRISIYEPSAVNGSPWTPNNPIDIQAGDSKIVNVLYNIHPDNFKGFNVLVYCPMISTLNINNQQSTSICRAFAATISSGQFMQATTYEQFKILPHGRDLACPPSAT